MKPSANEQVLPSTNGFSAMPKRSDAISEMRRAQSAWRVASLSTRLGVIRRFRHLLAEHGELIAHAANTGGHRITSQILASEIIPLAEACKFLGREAESILAPHIPKRRGLPMWLGGLRARVCREPFGVVLVIAPSNYPIFLPGVQVLQALVAGNAVLLKPGPAGLIVSHQIARLLNAAGLPEQLLRVLSESPEDAVFAIESGVDKVFFTGSAHVGRRVLAQLSPCTVPSVMELSGCDAVIIRADADLDLAVRALVFGLRLNSGQTCIAPRRVLVARSVATEFEGRLTRALAGATDAEFSPQQQRRLTSLLLDALSEGAHLLAGNVAADCRLVGPIVLGGVAPNSPLLQEDIFGPLLTVMTVADDNEAVHLANDNVYGLGATIFSGDEIAAQEIADRIDAGVVVINDMIAPTADSRLPFGGRKLSGFGVTRGREGLLEMTTQKVVVANRSRGRPHFDAPEPWHEGLLLAFLHFAHSRTILTRVKALRQLWRVIARQRKSRTN